MIFSRSAEYAIRGLVHLASLAPGESAMVKNIAAESSIPEHFLAKILQDLARDGFLKSNKGPRGGFRLALPAGRISAVKDRGSRRRRRPLSALHRREIPSATTGSLCSMHDSWMPLAVPYRRIVDRNLNRRSGEIPGGEAPLCSPGLAGVRPRKV